MCSCFTNAVYLLLISCVLLCILLFTYFASRNHQAFRAYMASLQISDIRIQEHCALMQLEAESSPSRAHSVSQCIKASHYEQLGESNASPHHPTFASTCTHWRVQLIARQRISVTRCTRCTASKFKLGITATSLTPMRLQNLSKVTACSRFHM